MTIRFYALLATTVLASACSSPRPAPDAPARVSRVETATGPEDSGSQGPGKAADEATISAQAAAQVPVSDPGAAPAAVRDLWQTRRPLAGAREASLRDRVKAEPQFKKAMTTTLEARGWEFFFSTPAGATPALDALVAAVRALPDQGRKTDAYPLEALNASLDRLRSASGAASAARTALEATPGWVAVKELVERKDAPSDAEMAGLEKAGRLAGMDGDAWKALGAAFAQALEGERGLAGVRAEVEIPAMVAFFRYALDMKFLIIASPFKADKNPTITIMALAWRAAERILDEMKKGSL